MDRRDDAASRPLATGLPPTVAGGRATRPVESQELDASQADPVIGDYRLLQVLGEGGMGTVYLAEQSAPVVRRVALKLIREVISSPRSALRFEVERAALARLSHPNVAQLFEAGRTSGGQPWFAMELVDGAPITEACDRHQLSLEERLALMVDVCAGVHHAHQKGLLHRDLKPSNVLVTTVDSKLVPKVIDFGIAKLVDVPTEERPGLTRAGRPVGTPGYVSPEALGLEGTADIDTRTDVYSLGVMVFEVLVGALPYATTSSSFAEYVQVLARHELEPPSKYFERLPRATAEAVAERRRSTPARWQRALRGDLDAIVLKALARRPEDRYGSAVDLARDLERLLGHQPVLATNPTWWDRTRKLVRRRRGPVAAGVLLALALIGGFVARGIEADRARAAAAEAERARQQAELARAETERVVAFLAGLFRNADPGQSRGAAVTVREVLDRGAAQISADLNEAPLVRARLLHTIGDVYWKLGLVQEALPFVQEGLALREAELGPNHLDVATSLRLTAILATELGDRGQAEASFRRVLAIREAAFGPDHLDVANSLGNLGYFLMEQDRFDEAVPVLERAIAIREQLHGPDHPDLAPSLYNLGLLHQQVGDLERAEPLLLRALTIDRQHRGEDHPEFAHSLYGLGDLYREMGRHDDAEQYLRQALELQDRLLGVDNVLSAPILRSQARVALAQGDRATGRTLAERALAIATRSLPADHPDQAGYRAVVAEALAEQPEP